MAFRTDRAPEPTPARASRADCRGGPDRDGFLAVVNRQLAVGAALGMTVAASSTKAMRTILVAPGVPNGTPATMMMRSPAHGEAFAEGECAGPRRPCRRCHAHLRRRRECTPQTTARRPAVSRFGVIATIGGCGRSRATRSAVAPERGPGDDRVEIERLGDICRAAAAMASAPVASGSARCASRCRGDRSVALDLLGDAVHGRDRLDRILAGGAFGRQHDGVGAFEDRGGDVGDFGAGRHRRLDHRFQHLRRDDHRLAGAARRRASSASAGPALFPAAFRRRDRRARPSARRRPR